MPPNNHDAPLPMPRRLLATFGRFVRTEAASGTVLLAAAAVALAWANSPWHASYERLWHAQIALSIGSMDLAHSLHFSINEGLMTVFFLVVGLEIRHELHEGSLAAWRMAALPLAAALGGILVPAGVYLALASQPSVRPGWAVPMATDIAFALGVLVLLGRRVPPALRSLLLALAVVDDVAAILVIAVFYSSGIGAAGLLVAVAGMLGVALFQWLGVRTALPYVLPGAVVWFGLLAAGIHPTIAGVILGLVTPVATAFGGTRVAADSRRGSDRLRRWLRDTWTGTDRAPADPALAQPPVLRVRSALHPWVAFGIMPLFALANAGVRVDQLELTGAAPSLVAGIVLGLVLGKPLGIVLGSALAVKAGVCALPDGVRWRHLLLMGCLGGIGFTMSIFIAMLAFADDALLATARFAVLLASTLAALAGLLIGWLAGRRATA